MPEPTPRALGASELSITWWRYGSMLWPQHEDYCLAAHFGQEVWSSWKLPSDYWKAGRGKFLYWFDCFERRLEWKGVRGKFRKASGSVSKQRYAKKKPNSFGKFCGHPFQLKDWSWRQMSPGFPSRERSELPSVVKESCVNRVRHCLCQMVPTLDTL